MRLPERRLIELTLVGLLVVLSLFWRRPSSLFLLPASWTPGTATLVVDYGPGVRVDLVPGTGA